MKRNRFSLIPKLLANSLLALLTVAATTIPLVLIGRDTLGEAVIALIYLVPVAWSANRWGQLPGISAALAAALAFDFLFIPPFYTFAVARLEGWLVLAIFLGGYRGDRAHPGQHNQGARSHVHVRIKCRSGERAHAGSRRPHCSQANPAVVPGLPGERDLSARNAVAKHRRQSAGRC
jgi:hypothetical protein